MQINKTINEILDKLKETVLNLQPFSISGYMMHSSHCLNEKHFTLNQTELKLFLKMLIYI